MVDLLDQMRRNPQGNWTISDVARVCAEHGLICSAPKVSRPGHPLILTISFKRPIKAVYIRHLVHLIEGRESGS